MWGRFYPRASSESRHDDDATMFGNRGRRARTRRSPRIPLLRDISIGNVRRRSPGISNPSTREQGGRAPATPTTTPLRQEYRLPTSPRQQVSRARDAGPRLRGARTHAGSRLLSDPFRQAALHFLVLDPLASSEFFLAAGDFIEEINLILD